MRGTFVSTTGAGTSSDAARRGSASFLFPAGSIEPPMGCPPRMTSRVGGLLPARGARDRHAVILPHSRRPVADEVHRRRACTIRDIDAFVPGGVAFQA